MYISTRSFQPLLKNIRLCIMHLFTLTIVFISSWFTVQAEVVSKHDTSFTPDFSLRISLENITQGCSIRESVVVNGTSPGPTLRIKPNKVTWIRVYNDMTDQNLTMVKLRCSSIIVSIDD
jgi:hypothetical protein